MQNMLKRTYSVKKERSQNSTFSGVVQGSQFPRLAESVVQVANSIDISFKIFNGYSELPEIQGEYKASVVLQCQRCLGDLETEINHEFHFYIGREDQADCESEGYEVVSTVDGDMLDVISLVEDDIILNLPLVPMHNTDCNAYLVDLNKEVDAIPKETKKNPFAVLEGLKTNLKH